MPEMLRCRTILPLLICLAIVRPCRAQMDSASMVPYIRESADSMTATFARGDFKSFARYNNPSLIEMLGGPESFTNFMEKQVHDLNGVSFKEVRAGRILRVLAKAKPAQCIVEQLMEIDYQGTTIAVVSHLVGISENGREWTFADGNSDTGKNIRMLIPKISPLLVIPRKKQAVGMKLDSLLREYKTVY
jgi:hypothetical protein